jgi:hypothetical protein
MSRTVKGDSTIPPFSTQLAKGNVETESEPRSGWAKGGDDKSAREGPSSYTCFAMPCRLAAHPRSGGDEGGFARRGACGFPNYGFRM